MSDLILMTITGDDKPGVTAAVTRLLSPDDIDVLDIGQAVIHSYLSLSILLRLPGQADEILQQLTTHVEDLGLTLTVASVSAQSYEDWVGLQGRSRFILTLLARRVKVQHVAAATKVIAEQGLNIEAVSRLSGRVPLDDPARHSKACIEFSLRGKPLDLPGFKTALMQISTDYGIDFAVQEDNIYRRNRRLICFDMDSTLIETEVIDELAELAGSGAEVKAITASAMAGEIDFKVSLESRVKTLAGLDESVLGDVAARLPLMEGVEHLFLMLRKLGYKTAILSGGFSYFGKALQQKLGVDYVFANELEIENGRLTGRVLHPVVDAERKALLLRELAQKEGISLQQVIAVGDGANDLAMLNIAGMGIAFRAKPLVQQSAEQAISTLGLDSILYLMGIRDRDAAHLGIDSQANT